MSLRWPSAQKIGIGEWPTTPRMDMSPNSAEIASNHTTSLLSPLSGPITSGIKQLDIWPILDMQQIKTIKMGIYLYICIYIHILLYFYKVSNRTFHQSLCPSPTDWWSLWRQKSPRWIHRNHPVLPSTQDVNHVLPKKKCFNRKFCHNYIW